MRDRRLFFSNTRQRVDSLINTGVWEGVDVGRVNDWLRQFEEANCELLAACLLDNLAYRSKPQVLALFNAALTSPAILPQEAACDRLLIEALRERRDPGIRLVPVISQDQPPTKSGPYMLRLLARELSIREKWMLWASQLDQTPESVHTVIAVDDFCGSGKQFVERFLGDPCVADFRRHRPRCRFVYLAAAAHSDGIAAIKQLAPGVEVVPGEVLTPEHHFFDGSTLEQYQSDGIRELLLEQYDNIIGRLSIGTQVGKFGFQSMGLTYAFAHGTPNNTLPVFWHDNTDGWTPLLDR